MYGDFLGYFRNITFHVKVFVANFGVTFGKFGLLSISTSCYHACNQVNGIGKSLVTPFYTFWRASSCLIL